MTPDQRLLDTAVVAFREATAVAGDGDATRLRVLAHAAGRARRRAVYRRALAAAAAVLVVIATSSAAWTAIGWWRAQTPAQAAMPTAADPAPPADWSGRPRRVIPAAPVAAAIDDAADQAAGDRAETTAYGRAHRAHFVDDLPTSALAAWDAYLAAYPRGAFAPEARFNRALCLVRLARWSDAARALGPFARGGDSGYRRAEACTLLAWVRDRIGDRPGHSSIVGCE